MITRILAKLKERWTRARFAEIEAQTRASIKLTPRYETRRRREIARAQAMFPHSGKGRAV